MKKIVVLLIISIALIGVNVVSASSDADGFNGEIPIMGADSFQDSFNFPFATINIPLTGPFSMSIGTDALGGSFSFPFVAAADVPVDDNGKSDNPFNGPFSMPVSNVGVPLNGPISVPIVGVDIAGSLGLPIIESDFPF